MYIQREIEKTIKPLFKQYPVITVIGPRQSGKTTSLRNIFPKADYVSLEDIDNREFASQDPRGFLKTHNKVTIIDEVQRVPNLLSYLQTEVDLRNKAGQYVLSGSQNLLISEVISQSLAGRSAIIKLLPFSLNELNETDIKKPGFDDYLFTGFYPRIYDMKLNPTTWYSNYVQTYIEKDVRQIKNISDLNTFQKFLKICAGRTGQILNLSTLSAEIGVSHHTIKSWLSILEASFIIYFLKPYHTNYNKRIIKNPKLYFYDTGLASYLLGINSVKQINTHYNAGALFENLIISELVKNHYNKNKEPNLYYWRDKTGHEIDCIVESDKSSIIEIKSSATINEHFFSNLEYFRTLSDKFKPILVYGGDQNQTRKTFNVIPWKDINKINL